MEIERGKGKFYILAANPAMPAKNGTLSLSEKQCRTPRPAQAASVKTPIIPNALHIINHTVRKEKKGWLCRVSVSSQTLDARRCAIGKAPLNVCFSVAFSVCKIEDDYCHSL